MHTNPLLQFTTQRCAELGLGRADLARRVGYANVTRGLRRIDAMLREPRPRDSDLIGPLAAALAMPQAQFEALVTDRQAALAAEADAQWRAAFRPHALVVTGEGGRPKQIAIAAFVGAGRALHIAFPDNLPEAEYLAFALAAFRDREERIRGLFHPPEAIVINESPDRCRRYDLAGRLLGEGDEALRSGPIRLRV